MVELNEINAVICLRTCSLRATNDCDKMNNRLGSLFHKVECQTLKIRLLLLFVKK